MFENSSNGATGTPIHVHANEDETLYVLEGTMRAIIDGQEQLLGAGESSVSSNEVCAHQLINASESAARYLLLCTPGGFERFLEEAGQVISPGAPVEPPTAGDIERLKAAAPIFGITLLPELAASKRSEGAPLRREPCLHA